jgi:hypothetical protein
MKILDWILRLQEILLQMHYHRRQMSPATVLQRVRANGHIYRYFQEWTPSLKNQMKKNSLILWLNAIFVEVSITLVTRVTPSRGAMGDFHSAAHSTP